MSTEEKIPFDKPTLSIDEQIIRLRERGLIIHEDGLAKHYLQFIGYYRFTGYCLPFYQSPLSEHVFKPETTFEQVLECYDFDRKLRLLVLDAIERIEVAFRACVSNTMASESGDPFWYLQESYFESSDYWNHGVFLEELHQRMLKKQRQERFLKAYYHKYSNEYPPSWMVFEILTLGDVSKLFGSLKLAYRKAIASHLTYDEKMIKSWMQAITDLRNDCAHHARIYDKVFKSRPKIAKAHKSYFYNHGLSNDRLYAQLVVIQDLLNVVSPQSEWSVRLRDLLGDYPNISLANVGFPESDALF